MGTYPDLSLVAWMNDAQRQEQYAAWKANPDLPLTHTIAAEDIAFAKRLSKLTGRRFVIMSNPQNEYMRRGRAGDTAQISQGNITTTKYHFGDNDAEVKNQAFISSNPLTQDRVRGVHEIPENAPAGAYRNVRGFIHPIGNVYERSPDGVVCGSSFNSGESHARSSYSHDWFYAEDRYESMGSRLAEVF
jgi:hypothetical protein